MDNDEFDRLDRMCTQAEGLVSTVEQLNKTLARTSFERRPEALAVGAITRLVGDKAERLRRDLQRACMGKDAMEEAS